MENLTRENLATICRLCLKCSKFSISIFDRIDPNPNKKSLKDRIFEMYSIKISSNDGLPTNICHRCLYHTEMYTDFRENVRQCESKLQSFVMSMNLGHTSKPPLSERPVNGRLKLKGDDNIVTIVDPSKEYQSTDDESYTSDMENSTAPAPVKQQTTKINRCKAQQIKNVFFCEYCDKAFVNQEECFRHESTTHDQLHPHICSFCTFQCASRNTIIAHIKECHDPKPFLCTQCNKQFGRRSDLRKHSVVHTGIRPFRCTICSKNFSRNTNLTKHLRIHEKMLYKRDHDSEVVNASRSQNDTENMVISLDPFNDQDSIVDDDNHLKPIPQRPSTISDQTEPMPSNTQNNHPNQSSLTGISACLPPIHMPLPNPINIPAQKPSIPVPVQSIEPIEIEQEPESSISSLLRGNLPTDIIDFARHVTGDAVTFMPNKTNKEPVIKPKIFLCDNCPKKFATQSSLLNHKNIHLDIRNHLCSICNKSFIRKRELDRHLTIHTTNRPYGCTHCPKKFGRKDKLVRHERTHLDVKIFSCPKCHLAFNRKDGMLLHMKVHDRNDNEIQEEMFSPTMRTNNEMLNLSIKTRNEYDTPMNLVLTEQTAGQQKMHSLWPNLDIKDTYSPFQ